MKPCRDRSEDIAWLALDLLPEPRAASLREHLARCPGCRRYSEGMQEVCQHQSPVAESDAELVPSPWFHAQLVKRIQEDAAKRTAPGAPRHLVRLLSWPRWSWAAGLAALMLGAVSLSLLRQPDATPTVATNPLPPSPGLRPTSATLKPAPTLARYHSTIRMSMDGLEALLERDGFDAGLSNQPVLSMRDRTLDLASQSVNGGPDAE